MNMYGRSDKERENISKPIIVMLSKAGRQKNVISKCIKNNLKHVLIVIPYIYTDTLLHAYICIHYTYTK